MIKGLLDSILRAPRLPVTLALTALVLSLPSLWTGWQQDDYMHRYFLLGNSDVDGKHPSPLDLFAFLDGDSLRNHRLMDAGVLPWWTLGGLKLSFWRPLSSLSHWLDYLLWPASPVMMHLQSLFWFAALVALAALAYRHLMGFTWPAGFAALVYALDDAHGLSAGWLAGRNALLACFFGLLALFFHDRWRRQGWQPGKILGPVALLIGLLSGETALAVLAYVGAYALYLERGSLFRRLRAVLPYGAVGGVWFAAYSFQQHGTWGSGFYTNPLSEPHEFLRSAIVRGPILLLDQWGFPPSAPTVLLPTWAVTSLWIWAVVFLSVLTILLLPLVRRNRLAGFFSVGTLLSLPLACTTFPHGRLLFFIGFGSMGLLGLWMDGFLHHAEWLPKGRIWRMLAKPMFFFLVLVHCVIAPLLLPFNTLGAASTKVYVRDSAVNAPVGPEIDSQDLIIVNPPLAFFAHYLMTVRPVENEPSPRHLRVLAPGTVPLTITRPDSCTLVIRPEDGFLAQPFDNVFRGAGHPMLPEQRVDLTGLSVTILTLTPDSRPLDVAFRFSVPLESGSLRWLNWEKDGYTQFNLPGVGGSMILPPALQGF